VVLETRPLEILHPVDLPVGQFGRQFAGER
jgi:hypothetical protein